MNLYQKLVQREKGARKKINNGRFYARDVKVVDDSQLSVNGHLELVPAFLYSLYLTLYKTENVELNPAFLYSLYLTLYKRDTCKTDAES